MKKNRCVLWAVISATVLLTAGLYAGLDYGMFTLGLIVLTFILGATLWDMIEESESE